jgi:hyperosmotically inducible protein
MITKRLARRIGISLMALTGALVYSTACVAWFQQGVGERAGQAIDDAGRGIRRGVQTAFPRARAMVHEQELISRVYSRVHWDRTLVGAAIDLEVLADGTAILRGVVPDAAAKQRATVLTRDTVGVTRVNDELTVAVPVAVPVRVIEAAPAPVVLPSSTAVIKP